MELLLKFSNPSIILMLSEYGSDPRIKGSTILSWLADTLPLLGSIKLKAAKSVKAKKDKTLRSKKISKLRNEPINFE